MFIELIRLNIYPSVISISIVYCHCECSTYTFLVYILRSLYNCIISPSPCFPPNLPIHCSCSPSNLQPLFLQLLHTYMCICIAVPKDISTRLRLYADGCRCVFGPPLVLDTQPVVFFPGAARCPALSSP